MHFRTFTIICVNNSKKHLTKRFMLSLAMSIFYFVKFREMWKLPAREQEER